MKATERYGLPFPEPEDYGDGSTQIAALAHAINDELLARTAGYNALLQPETYIRTRSSAQNFLNSTVYGAITFDTDTYSSGPLNPASTDVLKITTPGIYHAGMFVWVATVAGVTANSSREFMLEFTDRRGPSIADAVDLQWEQTTLEASTGVAVTQYAIFPVFAPDYAGSGLRGYFRHANVASQMQVLAPSCMWISRLGDIGV